MAPFSAADAAELLSSHFLAGTSCLPDLDGPLTRPDAYAVQDLMVGRLGAVRGWKVGRAKTGPEPYCAPLPASRQIGGGAAYARRHGVANLEAELAFRLARDVPPSATVQGRDECAALVDTIVPAIEILETRLEAPAAQDPLWKLADLQGNGGLVLGAPVAWAGQDLGQVELAVGAAAARTVPHPFGDPLGLLCWTVNHVARHRGGLKRGDVVITGSYCGIVAVAGPQHFRASFTGYGDVSVTVE